MNAMVIRNLKGILTGDGFRQAGGRRPDWRDCSFIPGPAEIVVNGSGKTLYCGSQRDWKDSQVERVFDGSGAIATRGWLDSHTHSIFGGSRAREHFQRWGGESYEQITAAGGGIHSTIKATSDATDEELLARLIDNLRAIAIQGVTVVEVKSGYGGNASGELRLLRLINRAATSVSGLTVIPTFLALHALPRGRSEDDFVAEMIAALNVVASERLARCVDSFPERGFFSLESALSMSKRAIQLGLGVKVHADQLSESGTTEAFVQIGALSVDHLEYVSSSGIDALAQNDTVATMLPVAAFFLNLPYANARKLLDAGARVALATDYNPGSAPERCLRLTVQLAAGKLKMTAPEILCALTFNAATALAESDERGWSFWRCPGGFRGGISPRWLEELLLDGEPVKIGQPTALVRVVS